jgi:predicted NAD/FAD-binding protein
LRFNREARRLVGRRGDGPSLRRFLADGDYSDYFVERLLVPQASAVWSADPHQMWSFPASFLAEFFENHRVLQLRGRPSWRTITGGSRCYVEALIEPFLERVRLRAAVRSVIRGPSGVTLALDHGSERFDQVVLAVHSPVALALLADPSPAEAQVLGAIPYQRNEAVLHTDTSLMPRRRAAWASWNYHLRDDQAGRTTVTYHMNRLQLLAADREFMVTLNRTGAIDPDEVIRVIDYAHPVFTPDGVRAQGRWDEISGIRRTHYCGAYWGWGFHEDGVWSALRVSQALGGRGPLRRPGDREDVAAPPEPGLPLAAAPLELERAA